MAEIQFENKRLRERCNQLISQCEGMENERSEMFEEFEEMRAQIENLKNSFLLEQQNKHLKEAVENLKGQIQDSAVREEKQLKLIQKLKAEGNKLSKKMESQEDKEELLERVLEDNKDLKRELAMKAKLQEKYEEVVSENEKLRDLLRDKEQLAETLEFIVAENKRYRREQAELQELLNQAKETANELKQRLEESYMENSGITESKEKEEFNDKAAESEEAITKNLHDFSMQAASYRSSAPEEKYLLGMLNNKIESAESRIKDMDTNLSDTKSKEDILDELSKKLQSAEDRIRGKDQEISELQMKLKQDSSLAFTSMTSSQNVKHGWVTKRGNIIPTWNRRYFALSGLDNYLYYSKSPNERFLGMVNLNCAYVQPDTKYNKQHCFVINVAGDKRSYYMFAESDKEMYEWIQAIQERINTLSFV